ncbi:hypothetical protein GLOIN_2v515811 [Rhizophagus clarus]|uniref:F-box domain-containing protein n=1 Tax=Rhizophagus clarus TaxID=94130 RepID=A0A8H3QXG4_9GLOM|nr:hypothetical protein GLOIN_2v515811 [Rhizophagus clarus]
MSIKLPIECLIEIFEFIIQQNFDYITLRSCSLVNRQWCAVAMPMLWEEPLMNLQDELTHDKMCMPITTYIMCLSDETKIILSKCGIKITPTLKRKATFNYTSYLRSLDNVMLFDAAEMWIEKCNATPKEEQCFSSIFQTYQLLEQLYRNFIASCDNLRQLNLRRSDQIKNLSDVFLRLHFFPGAEKSLSFLNEFSFDGCMEPEIFHQASEISKNIQHLCINCICNDNKGLAELIRVQQKPLLTLSLEATTNFRFPNIENSLRFSLPSSDINFDQEYARKFIKIPWILCKCAFYDISNVMKSISKIIPTNLKMMWLSESWTCNTEALNLFLEGCEKRLSKPLLFSICNRTHQHDEIIEKYIVKNVLTNN